MNQIRNINHGMAKRGSAVRGKTCHGAARQGFYESKYEKFIYSEARPGLARRSGAWRGPARHEQNQGMVT